MPRAVDPAPAVEALRSDPHPGMLRGSLHALYDVACVSAVVLGAPWLAWRSLTRPGFARMVRERLGLGLADVAASTKPRVLVHGVSVGEVKGAQALVRQMRERYPELEVVVSTTTDTGIEQARRLFPSAPVVRFPADLSFVVRRFLRRIRPALVVLMELEIWPNFLRECNRLGVPVTVINGRITDKSHAQYRVFRKLLPQFDRISLFCVQAPEYADRFQRLDVDPARILVTGNIKADGLGTGMIAPAPELLRLLGAPPGRLTLVAGSTHGPEERYVVEAWRRAVPDARLILVPRHPPRCAEVERELAELGCPPQRLTRLRAGTELPDPRTPVLVDTIGELEAVYALADLVFVGGSLVPHGGQNVLEPAAQARPVLFGPSVENFTHEAGLLLSAGAALQVGSPQELGEALARLARDPEARARMARAGLRAVEAQKGPTRVTLEALSDLALARLAAGTGLDERGRGDIIL